MAKRGVTANAAPPKLFERIDWSVIGAVVALAAFSYSATVLYRNLEDISWPQVRETIRSFSVANLLLAGLFTALSYVALVGYDLIALRLVGAERVPRASRHLHPLSATR